MAPTNLAVRIGTAAVLAPLVLAVLFFAEPWAWFCVIAFASGVGAAELFGMTHPGDRVSQAVGACLAVLLTGAVYFGEGDWRWLITGLLATTLLGALLPLWRLGQIETAALRVMAGIAGPVYAGLLLAPAALLRRSAGAEWVVLILALAWFNDTAGYFVGRAFGKHKLYPAVSPKKTVEGYLGGIGGSLLAAVAGSLWLIPALPLTHALGLGFAAGVVGPLGDLVESLVKRSTGIKDSGWIIPGHGGLLDRVDAVLFVGPIVYVYRLWATG